MTTTSTVLIRSRDAGVHYGTLMARDGNTITLHTIILAAFTAGFGCGRLDAHHPPRKEQP